jgi:predicted dehydrogenase
MTKIAIIGAGYIAQIHARAAQNAGAEVLAAVNWRPESLAKLASAFGITRAYATVEALIQAGEVDAAVICTPNALHAPQAIALLDAGIHVMVEKPMAMNAAEAAHMRAAAERGGCALMVAHCWRFDNEVLLLREYAAAGDLGAIIRTKSYGVHTNWGPSGWFAQRALAGGGALADMGVHAIDTARFLLGDPLPESVYARLGTHYGDYDVDDTSVILITWAGGATSYVESGWWQPHADGLEAATQLYGAQGFGQLFPTYLKLRWHGKATEVRPHLPPRTEHCPQSMYDRQMVYFLRCVETGEQPTPGGEEGLVIMRIVDAAYESARSGEAVKPA